MALTAAEKLNVRRYLGYSAMQPDNDWLGRTLDIVPLRAGFEDLIRTILGQIAAVDTSLAAASSTASRAGLKRVEDVEFFSGAEALATMMADRNRLIDELASLLGVERLSRPGGYGGGAMLRG